MLVHSPASVCEFIVAGASLWGKRTMILVIITAALAVSSADKLDKTFLPPLSAKTAGGHAGFLQTPFSRSLEQGSVSQGVPAGGFANEYQGVVVDAANPGTRASGVEQTGLGGPRSAYGSSDSKVGDAAFKANGFGSNLASTRIAPGFDFGAESGKAVEGQGNIRLAPGFSADSAQGSNTLKYNNEIGLDKYNYGYETENGIAVGQNGVASGGVKAEGGYSYEGNDGKVYKVTYTADKNGYKPEGSHLPTPPPVPKEIQVSLEKNAEDEAAGVVDDGSYDAQKYKDEGDYDIKDDSVNKPGSGATGYFSSQGSQFGSAGFGTGASSTGQFGQSPSGFGSQQFGAQGQGSKPKTESRFGAGYNAQGLNKGNSAFSSAVTSGSGSASAFAQSTDGSGDYFRNQNQDSTLEGVSQASADSQPGLSTSFASVQGTSGSAFGSSVNGGFKNQYGSNLPSSATASASVFPKPSSAFGSQKQFGTYQSNHPGFSTFPAYQGQGKFGPNFGSSEYQTGDAKPGQFGSSTGQSESSPSVSQPTQSTFSNQGPTFAPGTELVTPLEPSSNSGSYYSPNSNTFGSAQNSQAKPVGAFVSTTQKPSFNQPQGSDSSYIYNQPNKPFSTPVSPISSKFPSPFPQPSKHTNAPVSPTTASQTTQSNYNGITQAAISSFPSGSPTAPTLFGTQPTQFGSTPSQFNYESSQTSKPFVQSQSESEQSSFGQGTVSSTVSPAQEYEGTVYEYKKPPQTLPTPSPVPKKPESEAPFEQKPFGSQGTSGSKFQQTGSSTGSQFGQKPFGTTQTGSIFQQNQFGSSAVFGQKPESQVSGFSSSSQASQQPTQIDSSLGSQFGKKPIASQKEQTTSTFQQNQFGSSSVFSQKPETQVSSFSSGSQSSQQQTQFDSSIGSQFGQKPQTSPTPFTQQTFGSSQTGSSFQQTQSQFGQKPGSSLFSSGTINKGQAVQTSQFPVKPQTGFPSFPQNQFNTFPGSQFGKKPQSNQVNSFTSTTTTTQNQQSSQFGQKPFGGSQIGSYQQSQFGNSGSAFGQKPQNALGSSSLTGTQSQFGQKPFGTTQSGSTFQQNQGSFQSGSTFQQNQYGSQSEQKPSTSQGSTFTSNTLPKAPASQTSQFPVKPQTVGTTFQQNQHTQSQFGQNPFGTTQLGSTFQQNQGSFQSGSTFQQNQYGSQSEQKPSTFQGSTFTSNTLPKAPASQTSRFPVKPQTEGTTFQQNQFGASGSQFTDKPGSVQGSDVSSGSVFGTQSTQYGKKPQTGGSAFQQNQFGSSSLSQSQSTQGSSLTSNSDEISQFGQKPFGSPQTSSSVQQTQFGTSGTQFGSKPVTSQGSSIYSSTGSSNQAVQSTQFGLKPQSVSSQPGQFGARPESQFNQKPQSTQGTSFTSTTTTTQQEQTTQFVQKPFGSQSGFGSPQNQFGSSTGSYFNQKPFSSSQTGSIFQQSQFGSSGSTFGKKPFTTGTQSQFGQKPFGSPQSGSTFQQNQNSFQSGSAFQQNLYGSQVEQKPSTGSAFASNTVPKAPTVQPSLFPQKPQTVGSAFQQNQFGSSGSKFGQTSQTTQGPSFTSTSTTNQKEQSTQFGQTPFGGSQTGSSFQGTQFGSSGSQFGKKPQSEVSKFQQNQVVSTTESQFVLKPQYSQEQLSQFGSSQATDSEESVSQFGKKPEPTSASTFPSSTTAQKEQTSQYDQKPFGSAQNVGSLSTSSGYEQSQFNTASDTQFGQEQETIKESTLTTSQEQSQGVVSQFGQKPFGSQNTGSSFQQNQLGSTAGSQYTQTQLGQKPFGSSQTGSNNQQSQFGSTGSQFTSTFGQSSQSSFPQKPFGSQNVGSSFQQNQYGSSTGSQSGSSSTTEYKGQTGETTLFGQKPFGSQTTGSSFQQNQVGSVFSSQSPVSTPRPQFGNKPFGSTQGSFQQPQFGSPSESKPQDNKLQSTSAVFGSPFGSQPQKPFGSQPQKPFGSTQTVFQQNKFGSSQFGQKPQVGQAFASKPSSSFPQFGSQPKPFGDAQSNKFSTGIQTQKPFGTQSQTFQQSSENSESSFGSQVSQSEFGSQPKPSAGSESGYQTQFGQYVDQKNQESTQAQSAQSSSGSVGFVSKPTGTFGTNDYSYQKPQSTFGNKFGPSFGSSTDQKVQPNQSSAFASASSVPFGVSTTESSFKESQTTLSQFGAQPAFGNNFASTSRPQFGAQPVSSTTASSVQPTQSSLPFSGQTFKPFGSSFGVTSTQIPQVSSQTSRPQFGQAPFGSTVAPGFQTTSQNGGVHVTTEDLQSLQKGEQFGGPRDPPKFDDKTGYHY